MKCEDVLMVLDEGRPGNELARRAAGEHLSSCDDCRSAAHALAVLKAERNLPIDPPSEDAFRRAIVAAASRQERERPRRATFWLGVGVGAALAASVATAVVMLRPLADSTGFGVPAVTLAVNEVRNVDLALTAPEPLASAEIHVSLSGEIGLDGFADQRELRWTTDLDRGVNQLTLPIVAPGLGRGSVRRQAPDVRRRRARGARAVRARARRRASPDDRRHDTARRFPNRRALGSDVT